MSEGSVGMLLIGLGLRYEIMFLTLSFVGDAPLSLLCALQCQQSFVRDIRLDYKC